MEMSSRVNLFKILVNNSQIAFLRISEDKMRKDICENKVFFSLKLLCVRLGITADYIGGDLIP